MEGPARSRNADENEELRALARLLDVAEEGAAQAPAPASTSNGVRPGALVSGRFQVVTLLGVGSHGGVWRVRDHTNQGRELALKVLRDESTHSPAFEARCRDLLERLQKLTHATVNRLRDVGRTEDGRVWLAWDLVRGETLRTVLEHRGALPPRRALEIARQILGGLEQGHSRGLVHGGVSPDNVVLANRVPWSEENPFAVGVQLLDFGFRPLLGDDGAAPQPAEDLVAVAALLAQLITGSRIAPDGSDWMGSRSALATAALSPAMRRVLDTALARDPGDRYPSASAFRAAIERSPDWRGARRLTARWIGAATLSAVAATVFGVLWIRSLSADPALAAESEPRALRLDAQVATLRGELERARSEQAGTLASLETARGEEEDWRRRAEADEAERERTAAENVLEVTTLQSELERAHGEQAETQEMLATSRAQENQWRRRAEAAETERERIAAESALLAQRLDGEVPTLQSELERARSEQAETQEMLATSRAQEDQWRRRAETAEAERERIAAESALLAQRLDREVPTLQSELERAHSEQAETQEMLATSRAQEDQWRRRAETAEAERERIAAESALLAQRLDREVPTLQSELERAHSEQAETQESLATSRAGEDDWRRRAATAAAERDRAHAENERLAQRITVLETAAPAQTATTDPPPSVATASDVRREEIPADPDRPPAEVIKGLLLSDASAFPGPDGAVFLFHAVTPEGDESWQWEEVRRDEPAPGSDASWIVVQRFFDGDGVERGERTVRVLRRGTRFIEVGLGEREILDLGRAAENYEIRTWSPGPMPDLPAGLPVTAAEVQAFRSELAGREVRSLVVLGGAWKTWFSPELGLVRHADPRRLTRELVVARLP